MGIKKLLKIKPPEEESHSKNREELMELGITTKNPNKKKRDKFAAYGQYARDKSKNKVYAPPGYESYARGETEDLNRSELDGSQDGGSEEPSYNPYQVAGNSNDPYAAKSGNGLSSDPFASVGAGAVGIGSRNFSSAYDGLTSYTPRPSAGTSSAGAGTGAISSPYNDVPGTTNISNGRAGASQGIDASRTNPYGRRAAAGAHSSTTMGSGGPPKPAGGNPYSSMGIDEYSEGMRRPNLDLDLDLNEGPRPEEFNPNNVAVEEDLNETIKDQGDNLNSAPVTQQQELLTQPAARQQQQPAPQRYDPTPQWQFEEEEVGRRSQGQDMGASNRGFKTFEELQKEEEARQQQEEDEAVDEVKQEIRFTKQGSVQSTRNTLRMAEEAEMSGMNTIGMLGHQNNQFGNIENNLDLMYAHNRVADDKIGELKKLNRNMLAVRVGNPFNSRRRAREKAETMKNRKIEEKMLQEEKLQHVQSSSKRVENAMNPGNEPLTTGDRYKREEILKRAKRYQFEADEEDDMMEVEIDRNLDQIGSISGRLKKLALATGDEIDAQRKRLGKMEDNTDNLDIHLHMNTQRMAGIR
ncbi:protein transport protein S9 plasma membrane t-SNARE [Zygosaccharomyces mellis]|uniref:Protein transport protein S9 plasma membrane t-SNARE n=1 Tax=Zygosaccharomyces mellis TaxID=42258 RepID=A0A4C2E7Q1_9SACH|nr:protein transport protein S9 plasma membrane t-SNARE [Zygosaccharomyces mellis]